METFLIKAAQLILAFAILVIIHEFGHFLFARIFGVRVEKFYIFFDPWKEIFKWKPKKYIGFLGRTKKLDSKDNENLDSKKDEINDSIKEIEKEEVCNNKETEKKSSFWGDTEYGVGWLPLGGYCKIAG
ncbi:MAG: site-2 protease family protein, partial [Muribaculaceae bacterium]|nr:site-2 protease family protein [Muribaculaceae bacterium]